MMNLKRVLFWGCVLLGMLVATACGDDTPNEPTSTDPPDVSALTFRVVNEADHVRYVAENGLTGTVSILFERREDDGRWSNVNFDVDETMCSPLCSSLENGDLCVDCAAPASTVAKLEPGAFALFDWDGLEDVPSVVNSCLCHDQLAPRAGTYRMTVCSSAQYDSQAQDGEASGVSLPGTLEGEPECVDRTFELPSSEEEIVIEL
ncbi:MAG: hypothetical protein MUC50_12330 [Myxococcota bacterium]|nr:hypothetical protein [Myxococcota bacterium]